MTDVYAPRFLAEGSDDLALALEMATELTIEGFRSATLLYKAAVGEAGAIGPNQFPTNTVFSKIVTSGSQWRGHIFQQGVNTPDQPTPGVFLTGQGYAMDDYVLNLDPALVYHDYIPVDQNMRSPIDVANYWFRLAGNGLAAWIDRRLFIKLFQSALTPASTKDGHTMHLGGNAINRVAGSVAAAYPKTVAGCDNLVSDLEDLMLEFQQKDLPPNTPIYLAVRPDIEKVLRQDTSIFSGEYNAVRTNSLNNDVIGMVAGFSLLGTTNHLPTADLSSDTHYESHYRGNYTVAGLGTPVALAMAGNSGNRPAIGTLIAGDARLKPIYTHMEFLETNNAWFVKAQCMIGSGVMYPTSAGALYVTSS